MIRAAFATVLALGVAGCAGGDVAQDVVDPRRDRYFAPSGSMEPAVAQGTTATVTRIDGEDVRRCDIVVFRPPAGADGSVATAWNPPERDDDGTVTVKPADTRYLKRVIGLPGEEVAVSATGVVTIDDEELGDATSDDPEAFGGPWGPKVVPDGTVMLLGDNRDNSADSRVFGFVPFDFIEGRVIRAQGVGEERPRTVRRTDDCA